MKANNIIRNVNRAIKISMYYDLIKIVFPKSIPISRMVRQIRGRPGQG